MTMIAFVPLAVVIGANVVIATESCLGTNASVLMGPPTAALGFFFWFGLGLTQKSRNPRDKGERGADKLSTDAKTRELLTEARIVLPGVQAVLGFRFAAYLTETFDKLPTSWRMAKTPNISIMSALSPSWPPSCPWPSGLPAISAWCSIRCFKDTPLAFIAAALALAGTFPLWFGVPLLMGWRSPNAE